MVGRIALMKIFRANCQGIDTHVAAMPFTPPFVAREAAPMVLTLAEAYARMVAAKSQAGSWMKHIDIH